jgi:Protein of unknown function (DUF1822)
MNFIREKVTFKVPLTSTFHQIAEELRKQQRFPERAKQVYLNTLSVLAVDSYLQCMGIETDLAASNSQNPIMIILSDTADLIIKNIGKLECRTLLPNQEFVHIPLEAQEDRIGYIVVQMNESLREATLLGFVKELETEDLPINQLQSLEDFLEHIETLSQVTVTQSVGLLETVADTLQQIFNTLDSSWQTMESLLGIEPPKMVEGYRQLQGSTIERPDKGFMRAKQIDLDSQLPSQQIALVVALMPADDPEEIDVLVEVRPTSLSNELPRDLQLMLLDQIGAIILYAQRKEHDHKIEFEFSVKPRENFSIKLVLGDLSYVQEFLI